MRLEDAHNIFDLREIAKKRLPRWLFEFVDRGTEEEVALRNNREAFERIKLIPRMLVDVSGRKLDTTVFGKEASDDVVRGARGERDHVTDRLDGEVLRP